MRLGSIILLGLFRAEALIIYPIVWPRDISLLYKTFRRVGPQFQPPFVQTAAGEELWVQAMLLDGEELRRQIDLALASGFETRDGHKLGYASRDRALRSGLRTTVSRALRIYQRCRKAECLLRRVRRTVEAP